MDRGGVEARASSSDTKEIQGGCWLSTPLVWLFVSVDWKWVGEWGRRGGGVTHYKGVFQIKASSSFISVFFLSEALRSCWRSLRISEHLSWRGSWDTLLALASTRPPPPNTHTNPPSLLSFHPAPLHWDFSLCTAKVPISTCMITAHSDLYSGESSSTSFGRRKAAAPASFMPHYKSGDEKWMKLLSLRAQTFFFQPSFERLFPFPSLSITSGTFLLSP